MFQYELRSKVRDRVTGYTGIIVCRAEWLYGCRRYVVQSQEMKDGKPVEPMNFDEDAIEIVEAAPPHKMKSTGGPQPDAPRARNVSR